MSETPKDAAALLDDQEQPKMKILIADDESTMRMLLASRLTRLGYQVEVAHNGDQAWESLQAPDAAEIAILDWMMPGATGVELCRKLRARREVPYVYIILLTGNDSLSDLVAGMEAGADDYMTKPFNPAELNARLRAGRRILDLQRELLTAKSQLEILANHDALTNLWNRRMILARFDEEIARAGRTSQPLGAILLDIDHFKQVNDRFGHATGDEVLQQVAKRLKESIRPYDCVGRYGGEEFLIVAVDCTMTDSLRVAERVRQLIAGAPMITASGAIAITASFGVSSARMGEAVDPKALIGAADRALYRAKELGRNRVEGSTLDEAESAPGPRANAHLAKNLVGG